MPLQDLETFGYAVTTDMRGRASDKAIRVAGLLIHDSAGQSIMAARSRAQNSGFILKVW